MRFTLRRSRRTNRPPKGSSRIALRICSSRSSGASGRRISACRRACLAKRLSCLTLLNVAPQNHESPQDAQASRAVCRTHLYRPCAQHPALTNWMRLSCPCTASWRSSRKSDSGSRSSPPRSKRCALIPVSVNALLQLLKLTLLTYRSPSRASSTASTCGGPKTPRMCTSTLPDHPPLFSRLFLPFSRLLCICASLSCILPVVPMFRLSLH